MKKYIFICCLAACLTFSACAAQNPNSTPSGAESSVSTQLDSSKSGTENSSPSQKPAQVIENMAMGYRFSVSDELFQILKSDGTQTVHDDNFGADVDSETYYVMAGKVKQVLFTIYRLPKPYTAEEVQEKNPQMVYLGADKLAAFTILYSEDPEAGLTESEVSSLSNFMQSDVIKIPENFEIDALT